MTKLARPKAIVFDWDDTIVSTWHAIHAGINKTLETFGQPVWSEEEARARIGPPARVLFTELFGEANWQKADEVYLAAYQASMQDNLRVHAGAEELLRLLADSGVYTVVASTKRGVLLREEAAALGLAHYFARMVGAGDAPRDKPDPEVVWHALEGSGICPEQDEVWLVGDGLTDLQCARASGCKAVLLETKLPPEESIAPYAPEERFKDLGAFREFAVACIQQHCVVEPSAVQL